MSDMPPTPPQNPLPTTTRTRSGITPSPVKSGVTSSTTTKSAILRAIPEKPTSNRLWTRLRWQLMFSYLPLIFIPVLLIGLVTRSTTEQGLTLLVTQGAQRQAAILSDCFASYYQTYGSWDGLSKRLKPPPAGNAVQPRLMPLQGLTVDSSLNCTWTNSTTQTDTGNDNPNNGNNGPNNNSSNNPRQGPPDQVGQPRIMAAMQILFRDFRPSEVLITDTSGKVLVSTDESTVGQMLSNSALAKGAPIYVQNKQVGTLILGTAVTALNDQQTQLFDAVNRTLLISGSISVVLAIALGWGLSGQISGPMRQLMSGVRRLSTGQWDAPLEIHAHNEFGDLTVAFNAMANELMRQQQLNRQMIADIAHDLRTPLSVMLLEVEAIEAGFQSPEQATESLRNEITWLQRLVEDLRLLSLIDADQIKLLTERTALQPFLNGVQDFWETLAEEEGRTLSLKMDDDLPDIWIDPNRIRQVLGNLIDNAIRHTKVGGKIEISAKMERGKMVMRVSDNGEGIPPEDVPHIFDRFYRVDPARSRSDGGSGGKTGSGLGLSISRRLVEMHGGTIEARSMVGKGTTFTIRLPQGEA